MAYKINPNNCIGCGGCTAVCPAMAITPDAANPGKYNIDPAKCASCGVCASVCPAAAISAA